MHVAGALTAIDAIMNARSSQGSIAWALSLVFMPYVALPAYWVLGRSKFRGYVLARRAEDVMHKETVARIHERASEFLAEMKNDDDGRFRSIEKLARMPFTRGNHAELLIDGKETFDAILAEIPKAQDYILVQFYIVRDDGLGRDLKNALIERARAGVKVCFLYDEIGSKLTTEYLEGCREAGIDIRAFNTTKGRANRFQVNFRNHRKIVVIDGKVGFVGGHNVGDEYLGKDPEFGNWRDTHMRLEGPTVIGLQFTFAEDWYWAARSVLDGLEWMPTRSPRGDMPGLILGSGPADDIETCSLLFVHAISSARRRCWIASPYFVPSEEVIAALQLAGLRGVDVRILLPKNPDHKMVWLASFSYLELAGKTNIKFFRYTDGFMHQKVMLIDNAAAVGTANMDNRSFRLNFEVTGILVDEGFAGEVEKMFLADFEKSVPATPDEFEKRGYLFKFAVKVARLLSPIL